MSYLLDRRWKDMKKTSTAGYAQIEMLAEFHGGKSLSNFVTFFHPENIFLPAGNRKHLNRAGTASLPVAGLEGLRLRRVGLCCT